MHDLPGCRYMRWSEQGRLSLIPSTYLVVGGLATCHCGGVMRHDPMNRGEKLQSVSALEALDLSEYCIDPRRCLWMVGDIPIQLFVHGRTNANRLGPGDRCRAVPESDDEVPFH